MSQASTLTEEANEGFDTQTQQLLNLRRSRRAAWDAMPRKSRKSKRLGLYPLATEEGSPMLATSPSLPPHAWESPFLWGISLLLSLLFSYLLFTLTQIASKSKKTIQYQIDHLSLYSQQLQSSPLPAIENTESPSIWRAYLRKHRLFALAYAWEAGHPLPSLSHSLPPDIAALLSPPQPTNSPLASSSFSAAALRLLLVFLIALALSSGLLAFSLPSAWMWIPLLGGSLLLSGVVFSIRQENHIQTAKAQMTAQAEELQRWFHEELWPALPPAPRPRAARHALETIQQSLQRLLLAQEEASSPASLAALLDTQEKQTALLEQIALHLSPLSDLSELSVSLRAPLQDLQEIMERGRQHLPLIEERLTHLSRHLAEGLEPIAHSQRLLSERMTALSRHTIALSDMIERIEAHERQLPQRNADLLKLSLRPAHQLLQRASLSLVRLLEHALNQQTREREGWRHLMGELNKRLDSFDRLTHTHEKFVHEISSINDALAELSTQIRFRPIIPALNQEEPQDINEALDVEIEELLEGFQDLQSLSLPQER